MFSTAKRHVMRKCGITAKRIAELERLALTTKAKPNAISEQVFRRLASGHQSQPNAITKAIEAKLTKALPPPATPVVFVNNLLYNGHSLH